MTLSKNQEKKIRSIRDWKIYLISTKVQVRSSSELPLEKKENQKSLSN